MDIRSRLLIALLVITPAICNAEFKSGADDQRELWLTIYNGGRALVKDHRSLNLPAQTRTIALMDVAQKIMPQTVAIDGLQVLEQNYDFDLLSQQALINKNIGHKVRIARRAKNSGETIEWREGVILSTQGGVILKMSDGSLELLDNSSNYHLVFDKIPANLRISPTLSLQLKNPASGHKAIKLTYLTTGLSWQSDYVLQIDPDEKNATLDSWITLNNQSGIRYRNAHLQLLAGEVNMQRRNQPELISDGLRMKAMMAPAVSEQPLQGYHLYSVAHTTSINNRQSKQIKMFSATQIPVHKALQDRAYIDAYNVDPMKSKPEQFLLFENTRPALGIPLPKGVIRVYGQDASGQQQFLGEDRIGHTAVNEDLKIKLGKSFDVSVERQTLDVHQISKKQRRYQRRIRINNGGDKAQTITLTELMPTRNWRIDQASLSYRKSSPSSANFTITVPALKKAVITYELTVNF